MNTERRKATPAAIEQAAAIIRRGGLVIFPTETVYGLGANALDGAAARKIFAAKGRPGDNPLIAHIARWEDLIPLTREIPEPARRLAERFWPGALTMVLPKSDAVPDAVTAGLDTVAVRMPSHPAARALIEASRVPIAAPSANRSGSPSPTTAAHCVADMDGRVDMILDGGPCEVGLESTVITLAGPFDIPRLLRPGGVTLEQLRAVLGAVEADDAVFRKADETKPVASPGMKYKHYAPKADLTLIHGDRDAFARFVTTHGCDAALVFDGEFTKGELGVPIVTYGKQSDPDAQAERLFAALRELDEMGANTAYVRAPSTAGVGLAVMNRLMRAAAFREITLRDE